MAIITLLTDSGESDHYVAAIKARIIGLNPEVRIVDITHKIQPCDIGHAAFVLRSVFNDFPKGSVHLVGVDATGNKGDAFVALALEDHFFIGPDNGFFGLLSDQQPRQVIQLEVDSSKPATFPERDVFAPAAAQLANGVDLATLGKPLDAVKRLIDRQVKATKKQITGNVVRVDSFGNLITNIPKVAFDVLSKNKAFTVQFGGEKFRRIHTGYNQTEQGECFILFNSLGLLEIGIYKGNASELLGLSYDSIVNIIFED